MNHQLTGYEQQQQAIIDQMNRLKPALEEVLLPAKGGSTTAQRRVTNIEDFGRSGQHRCQRGKITYNKQKVWVYRRDDQWHWSLDMSVVL